MTAMICLLRGVNVGGRGMVKMVELRGLCEGLGLKNVRTYVQSGNVLFQTSESDSVKLAKGIENAIEKKFGFRPEVVLRTAAELRKVIAKNPFAKRRDIEPGKLLVMFMARALEAEVQAAAMKLERQGEELRCSGSELYIYFPDGMGRSKLVPKLNRILKNSGTGRNWNTVTKLLEMAEAST